MGNIFLSGQNQCHITGVKKSYFCHTFHLRPKKVSWWVGGGGHTDTEMDTELDKKK